jgi:bifunctional non-homologous end joining protein LigD
MVTRATKSVPREADETVVAGIRVSHPDRLIYPDLGFSKAHLARYYENIGDWILPHVRGRPLTLVHCPAGLSGPCIYLKHAKAWGPSALRRVRIQEKTKVGEYLVADSITAVVALAQMGIVEIHTWNSTTDDIEHPNRLVWDLDPGPGVEWTQTVAAAKQLRGLLQTLGLRTWVKTTGGRGLHVVVPIQRSLDWAECLAYSRDVSEAFVRTNPTLYTTKFRKRGRERQILIDYLRNNRTNTSICAYSPRASAGARVSVPLDWKDLRETPSQWTLLTTPYRLRRLRSDPWVDYWTASQRVSTRALKTLRAR